MGSGGGHSVLQREPPRVFAIARTVRVTIAGAAGAGIVVVVVAIIGAGSSPSCCVCSDHSGRRL